MTKCKPEKDMRTKAELLRELAEAKESRDFFKQHYEQLINELSQTRMTLAEEKSRASDREYERDRSREATELLVTSALVDESPVRSWERVRDIAELLGHDRDYATDEIVRAVRCIAPLVVTKALDIVTYIENEEVERDSKTV